MLVFGGCISCGVFLLRAKPDSPKNMTTEFILGPENETNIKDDHNITIFFLNFRICFLRLAVELLEDIRVFPKILVPQNGW